MGAEALTSRRTLRVLDDEGDLESGGDDDRSFWSDACADTSGPIFELGCGGGRILAHLATVGRELIGIDIDHHIQVMRKTRFAVKDTGDRADHGVPDLKFIQHIQDARE